MKISYITNIRIPTEKAHGYQIAKMCEEFARAGHEVELMVPTRKNDIKDDLFTFYNLERNFRVKYIRTFDFLSKDKVLFRKAIYLNSLFFVIRSLFLKIRKDNIIYTRSPEIAWFFSVRGYKTFFEAHSWPDSKIKIYIGMLKKVELIICNSIGTKNIHNKNGFEKLIVAPNGVDLNEFNIQNSKDDCRRKFIFPLEEKIVMYVGHLYDWKGVDTLIKSSLLFSDNTIFLLIGGTNSDIIKYKEKYKDLKNIKFIGKKPRKEIPYYLKSADVLVLPNVPISNESSYFTSPIKMFEYMASGVSIVASDLPSIRTVLNEKNAILFSPGDEKELFIKIYNLLNNNYLSDKIAKQAFEDVKKYTWKKRAKNIINFYEHQK